MEIDVYLQNTIVADRKYENEKTYWLNKFSNAVNASILYSDYIESSNEIKGSMSTYSKYFRRDVSKLLKKINKSDYSLYIMLMSGIEYMIRYLVNNDITIGIPPFIKEDETVINNMLIFNNQICGNETFQELLNTTRQIIKEADENNHFPLIHIAEELGVKSSAGRINLNIMCMLQNIQYKDEASIQGADICFCFKNCNDGIKLDIIYDTTRYSEDTTLRLKEFLETFFVKACTEPNKSLSELDYISDGQKNIIFSCFNDTEAIYDKEVTLSALFEKKVEEYGKNKAIIFEDETLTYQKLNKLSNNFARYLRDKEVGRNTIAAIISDKSLEMMIAIYAVIKAGGTYLPISAQYPIDRIKFILADSNAKVLLVQEKYIDLVQSEIELINLNDKNLYEGEGKNLVAVNCSKDAAYVIYTSGTTGLPKGVVIRHFSVINRISWMQKKYTLTSNDVILQKTPYTFDVSVWEIFLWFFKGASVCLLKSGDEKIPERITEVIYKNKISVIHFVPSMLSVFLDYISNGKKNNKIMSLRHVFASGEVLKVRHCKKFQKVVYQVTGAKLHNLYGPTEATVDVTYYGCSDHEINKIVPIGKPIDNIQLYVLNDMQKLLPVGLPGELYIAGDGLANGYLNRLELTAEKFLPNPFKVNDVMYKTGDFVRLLNDGNLEYINRLDHQVKIRGLRVELGEVEAQIINTSLVNDAAVIVVENEADNQYLCAFYTAEDATVESEIVRIIGQKLPEYMIPSAWVFLDHMPVTLNGKLDYKMLLELKKQKDAKRNIALPENKVQFLVLEMWKDILNHNNIGIDDNFFELGGHSIAMLRISERAQKQFGVEIEFSEFMNNVTVRTISECIEKSKPKDIDFFGNAKPDMANINKPFELTQVQRAYLNGRNVNFEMGGGSTHTYTEIEDDFDIPRLNISFNKLIMRHPMLRAVFMEGKQKILKNVEPYQIEINDLTDMSEKEKEHYILSVRNKMSHQVFELDKWPLFAIRALKVGKMKYRLCIGFDTLIADGESMQILFHELNMIYAENENELEDINYTFRDYVLEYNKIKNSGKYNEDKVFWMEKLKNMPPAPELLLKAKPEAIKTPKFHRITEYISKDKWKVIKEKAKSKAITPSALLYTLYANALANWCNQEKMTINLTVFNRLPFHKDVGKIVGDFTSVMLCETKCTPLNIWKQAQEVQQSIFEGLEHRYYDGIELIREYSALNHIGNRNLFPVVFTCALYDRNLDTNEITEDNILDTLKMGISQTSQVYLDHQVSEINSGLNINWDYAEDLLDENYIEEIFHSYINAIYDIGLDREPEFLMKNMKMYDDYNKTVDVIPNTTLHQKFILQAIKTPKNIAIIHDEEQITYEELNEKSDMLAGYLRKKGIVKGEYVAVYVKRCISSIVNILAILKAGAAYIPVDPDYPEDRKAYIMQRSNCRLMLYPDEEYTYDNDNVDLSIDYVTQDDIAYVIYTSGSTGNPKGVVITHKGALNTIMDINKKYHVDDKDRILGISSMCFDLSVYDIFGSLLSGAALVILNCIYDVDEIIDKIKRYSVTIWNSVPAIMDMVVENQKIINMKEQKYYWAPNIRWKILKERVYIEDKECPPETLDMFPELYYYTQDGVLLSALYQYFPEKDKMRVIDELIENKVLICTIQEPLEIFSSQDKLYHSVISDDIRVDAEKYEIFKKQQLGRHVVDYYLDKIYLKGYGEFPDNIANRKSYRSYDRDTSIEFQAFSQFLTIFSQRKYENDIKYYYASAGGLYPIDVYVYVKADRIIGLEKGLYYYSPIDNALELMNQLVEIHSDAHYPGNRKIYEESAFSLYFVYNSDANIPKYGSAGFYYACIELGIMIGALTQAAEMLNIGLCSIGDMYFSKIRDDFRLNDGNVFMHCIECGLKLDWDKQYNPYNFFDNVEILSGNQKNKMQVCAKETRLRLVMLSGDWIPLTLPDKIHNTFNKCEVVSLGGATEASIWSIYYPIKYVRNDWNSIPYGYPLVNQKIYVMNYAMELCPVGVEGEICIGGIGVAEGYLNEIQLTKDAFIEHVKYGVLYKTGDYGKMSQEGYVIFCGRRDSQVKIRGHRIELGEIEKQILNIKGIDNVVVMKQQDNNKEYLCAYFVGDKIEAADIKNAILDKIPQYMIPSRYIKIDKIPLTLNGKVDRKKLIKLHDISNYSVEKKREIPVNKIEAELSKIWKRILHINEVGRNDNFFDLGGNSISIVKMHGEIDRIYPGKLKIIEIFSLTTIALLAEHLKEMGSDDSKVKVYRMQPPMEYLNTVKKNKQMKGFNLQLNDIEYQLLVSKAGQLSIGTNDILLVVYMLTLSKLWKQSKVGINYLNTSGELHMLVYDLEIFHDINVLIRTIASNKINKDNRIGHISDYVYVKDQNAVVVSFIDSEVGTIEEGFDICLKNNITNKEQQVSFEYNISAIRLEKIANINGSYKKILDQILRSK